MVSFRQSQQNLLPNKGILEPTNWYMLYRLNKKKNSKILYSKYVLTFTYNFPTPRKIFSLHNPFSIYSKYFFIPPPPPILNALCVEH